MIRPEICVLGLNHAGSGVELREQFALRIGPYALLSLGNFSYKDELVVLSTCNRTELIACPSGCEEPAVSDFISRLTAAWALSLGYPAELLAAHLFIKRGREAVEHVFRVACGLDSMLLGETQILGQVKQAYGQAVQEGTSRAILNKLF
ncbi:MAG: glutamyl-tRNA reductase, partial [Desulfovibrionaceae bacterium]|nr:glutamyl-tRNA reductase [Desulfovibrionaceae bacterium]